MICNHGWHEPGQSEATDIIQSLGGLVSETTVSLPINSRQMRVQILGGGSGPSRRNRSNRQGPNPSSAAEDARADPPEEDKHRDLAST